MTDPHAVAEGLTQEGSHKLRILCVGMAGGVLLLAGWVAWTYICGAVDTHPNAARFINIMSMVAMGWTLAAIATGEFLWRRLVRGIASPADADGVVHMAFVLRLALREGAAMLGLVVCFLAARNGVLSAFPAYWVNAAPAALFLFFLWARWPSLDNLRAQVKDALPFA